jgi:hypothetical protein
VQIVGDPIALADDAHWGALLQHCVNNRAYKGCPCPLVEDDAPGDIDAMIERMAEMMLGPGLENQMYPDEEGADLEAFYRDELDFRVIL